MNSQKDVWDNIAEEWYMFRQVPLGNVVDFLKGAKGKILDLGCGAGRHLMNLDRGKLYLVDFSEEMIRLAKLKAHQKRISAEFYVADMCELPFEDNFFDNAICIASLHCVESRSKRKKAVEELYRVLKPNAEVLVSVYNKKSRQFRNSQKDKFIKWRDKGLRYYYLFDEEEIHQLFIDVGFKIVKKWIPDRNIEFIAMK